MEYLFDDFNKIEELLKDKFFFLLLDYDGTLAPISQSPDKAILPEGVRETLRKLSSCSSCAVSIISGRSINDIRKMVDIDSIIYAGNHGLEISGPKIKFESQVPAGYKAALVKINEELTKKLSGIKGVLIENKRLGISVHYRMIDNNDMRAFEKILAEATRPYLADKKVKVNPGKKVYEIKPRIKWDKGKVVLWLLARQQFACKEKKVLPIYCGDDATDEDAFRVLKIKGLTVFVGQSGNSQANYYVKDNKEVSDFLKLLLDKAKDRNEVKRAV